MEMRVGLDFGGVIVPKGKSRAGEDTALEGSEGCGHAQKGAFEDIQRIVAACDGRVWIVSKAGPRMQARTRQWLASADFWARTGMVTGRVRFCLEREEKAQLCSELGITHFVDDRVHVMQILRPVVPHLYLFGDEGDERLCPPWATFVKDWAQVADRIAPD